MDLAIDVSWRQRSRPYLEEEERIMDAPLFKDATPAERAEALIEERALTRRSLLGNAIAVGGAIGLSGAAGTLLAACGGSSNATAADLTAADIRNASGTIRVLGWQSYQQKAQDAGPVNAKWSYITSSPEIVTKVRPPDSYDVFTSSAFQMGEFLAIDRLVPIDTSLLTNFDALYPQLRDNPTWKGPDGKVYGVPFDYSDIWTLYLANKVPEPKSAEDFLRPEYHGSIGMTDDPTQSIPFIARLLGKQGDPARLTDAEFDGVLAYLDKLRPQVRTLYPSGDEIGLLDRGDISVAMPSFTFVMAAGIPNLKPVFIGSFGFCDGLSMLAGGDQAAQTSWIDQALSVNAQRQLAAAGPFEPAREDARDALPNFMRKTPFSEVLRRSPMMTRPPLTSESGVASLEDWSNAWNDYKSNF